MFTGLIETTGTLLAVTPTAGATRITIAAPTLTSRLNTGDSIAVNGVCLTALSIEPNAFPRASPPTSPPRPSPAPRSRTSAPTPSSISNSPPPPARPSGATSSRATSTAPQPSSPSTPSHPHAPDTDWRLRIQLPEALTRYVVPQGSITIEGISLTVASIVGNEVEVAIIPHTYAATSLRTLTPAAPSTSKSTS